MSSGSGYSAVIYRYNSICEPDYIKAFESLGINVIEIREEMTDKGITNSERVRLVEKAVTLHHPMFVFSINFFPSVSDICSIYGVLYLCQTVDSPINQLFSESVRHGTNRIFLFDKAQFQRFNRYNKDNIFHLPLCANTERYDEVISGITKEDRKKYSSDISFVGSLYSEKTELNNIALSDYSRGYIDSLIHAQAQIYGCNFIEDALDKRVIDELKNKLPEVFAFDKSVEDTDAYIAANSLIGYKLAEYERIDILNTLAKSFDVSLYTRSDTKVLKGVDVRGGVSTHTEMPKVFNLSRINLNITIRPIAAGIPLRVFDIMGCKGFVMTNYQEELSELFKVGEEIEVFTDKDELTEKCRYYLEHDEERARIAKNGYERVKGFHTFKHRVREMIRTVTAKQ
ncbi:MAG: glycosyltransferase [Lachnospiraceae bacterium]|nr:glycosyltransferase [Lachnospiraceae bacterium]